VISGKEMDQNHAFDAMTEMTCTKGIEMVCESIPACCLQVYAILQSRDGSRQAVVSVAVSALTTGFNSASISFDYDGKTSSTFQMHPTLLSLTLPS